MLFSPARVQLSAARGKLSLPFWETETGFVHHCVSQWWEAKLWFSTSRKGKLSSTLAASSSHDLMNLEYQFSAHNWLKFRHLHLSYTSCESYEYQLNIMQSANNLSSSATPLSATETATAAAKRKGKAKVGVNVDPPVRNTRRQENVIING